MTLRQYLAYSASMEPLPPSRKSREPKPGSRFPSEVLAQNVRLIRRVLDLSQGDLAERMASLGHRWVRQTVGEVERSGRVVSIDEQLGLAMALGTSLITLLDPSAIRGQDEPAPTDVGLRTVLMDDLWPLLVGSRVGRLVPYNETFGTVKWDENEPVRWVTFTATAPVGESEEDDWVTFTATAPVGESEDERLDSGRDA